MYILWAQVSFSAIPQSELSKAAIEVMTGRIRV